MFGFGRETNGTVDQDGLLTATHDYDMDRLSLSAGVMESGQRGGIDLNSAE